VNLLLLATTYTAFHPIYYSLPVMDDWTNFADNLWASLTSSYPTSNAGNDGTSDAGNDNDIEIRSEILIVKGYVAIFYGENSHGYVYTKGCFEDFLSRYDDIPIRYRHGDDYELRDKKIGRIVVAFEDDEGLYVKCRVWNNKVKRLVVNGVKCAFSTGRVQSFHRDVESYSFDKLYIVPVGSVPGVTVITNYYYADEEYEEE
jgi:hypothetical protein